MKPKHLAAVALIVGSVLGATAWAEEATAPKTWTFDSEQLDAAPLGFSFGRTGRGAVGRWLVRSEKSAPSGANVLAQVILDARDQTFKNEGKVGVWTKADSVTLFDDLSAKPL